MMDPIHMHRRRTVGDLAFGRALDHELRDMHVLVGIDRDGNAVDGRSIPDDVVNELSARVSALDPLADVQLDATCDRCGNEWEAPFDIVPFVWSEIEGAARGLLVDVHDLAVAYGWSEHEVLSLTPERRQAYLELVRG